MARSLHTLRRTSQVLTSILGLTALGCEPHCEARIEMVTARLREGSDAFPPFDLATVGEVSVEAMRSRLEQAVAPMSQEATPERPHRGGEVGLVAHAANDPRRASRATPLQRRRASPLERFVTGAGRWIAYFCGNNND